MLQVSFSKYIYIHIYTTLHGVIKGVAKCSYTVDHKSAARSAIMKPSCNRQLHYGHGICGPVQTRVVHAK